MLERVVTTWKKCGLFSGSSSQQFSIIVYLLQNVCGGKKFCNSLLWKCLLPRAQQGGRLVALSVSTCSCLSAVCGHKNEQLANNCCLFNKRKTNKSQQARINECRSQSTQCHVKVDQLELLTCPQSRLHSLACRVSLHSSAAAECP